MTILSIHYMYDNVLYSGTIIVVIVHTEIGQCWIDQLPLEECREEHRNLECREKQPVCNTETTTSTEIGGVATR